MAAVVLVGNPITLFFGEHLGDTMRHLMQYGLTLHDFLQQVIEHTMSSMNESLYYTCKVNASITVMITIHKEKEQQYSHKPCSITFGTVFEHEAM